MSDSGSAIPDERALFLQLAAVAGNEPTTSFIEIRPLEVETFMPSAKERCWIPARDFDQAAARIDVLSPAFHVYIGAAPRVRQGGTVEDVERVWCLWADCDAREAGEALAAFRRRPSLVVQTRQGRWQGWWPLRQPVRPLFAKRANQRLAKALGADRAAVDAARILRPIGSLNHKTSPASPVRCLRCELDVYLMRDVIGGLPDVDEYTVRQSTRVRAVSPANADATLDGLARKVREAVPPMHGQPGERNPMLYWAARRLRDHVDDGTLDETEGRQVLHQAALEAGLNDDEIKGTLDSALGRRTAA
jgi:hypothetical protein